MNLIASLFLRARHWQIFLLLVGVGIASSIWLVVAAATITPENFARIILLDAGLTYINMLFLLAWLWAMGSFLNSIVEPALGLGIGFFRFALIYPVIYVPLFLVIASSHGGPIESWWIPTVFALHFLGMFCLLYNLHFAAKTLVLAETRKPASFNDYARPFFLLWFFPIGIWFTQPRINRLYFSSRLLPAKTNKSNAR